MKRPGVEQYELAVVERFKGRRARLLARRDFARSTPWIVAINNTVWTKHF